MKLKDMIREHHIGEYLAQESPKERAIQDQLKMLITWEFIFTGVLCRLDTVERIHAIRFEIRPRESGHNMPHCHASYQGQKIYISLITCEILECNIPTPKQRFAVDWVKHNLPILQVHWNRCHALEV